MVIKNFIGLEYSARCALQILLQIMIYILYILINHKHITSNTKSNLQSIIWHIINISNIIFYNFYVGYYLFFLSMDAILVEKNTKILTTYISFSLLVRNMIMWK